MTRILVIEDEPNILHNLLEILEMEGYEAEGASDGLQGIHAACSDPPDLILCDIMMPQLSGYEVLQQLRSEPDTTDVPVVFLTALNAWDDIRRGMELGVDDYLTKPINPAELLGAINTQLQKRSQRANHYQAQLHHLRASLTRTLPHELRTPLTGIIGSAEFLMTKYQKIEPERARSMAEVIMKSALRLQRLVENYLLYAQLEIAAHDPELLQYFREQCVDHPAHIISESAREQAARMGRLDDLRLYVTDASLAMAGENLEKLVEELVANALKFSQNGDEVRVEAGETPSRSYFIRIVDQGRGMTAEEIAMSGPYMQFNRALHEQQGVGLGLAIARRLVELHDGQFAIDSAPGAGTTITIALPVCTASRQPN
jgi:two-component system, sensor histidine kinase and response regulator